MDVTFGPRKKGLCTANYPLMCPGRRWGHRVYIDGEWTPSFTCEDEAHASDVVAWVRAHGAATGMEPHLRDV